MSLIDDDDFLEFVRNYEDGDKVIMRGLYAAPFVVKKYKINPEEVIAFTSWHGNHKASTVFHFHPQFDPKNIRSYMEGHDDGKALLEEVRAERDSLSGWEWLEMVRATGVWSEIIQAITTATLKPVVEKVSRMIEQISWEKTGQQAVFNGVSARSLSLATPPVPQPIKFPVILFPKTSEDKVEGISSELANLTASHAMKGMTEPVSTAIH
ncbi:MAG: hypothetical protein OQJ97_07645 [Rhodospirillales bacterium]|nr:hypothetical protein [Rhodospirillales bacterium]